MPDTALIYTRLSRAKRASATDDAEDRTEASLETQEDACRRYCAERGYTVSGVFSDVHTGAEWRERPGLSRLREAVQAGAAQVVVAHALDRVSRQQLHLAVFMDELEQRGARLELATETMEDTAIGRFLLAARSFAAEVEREKMRERVLRAKDAFFRAGKRHPTRSPGYGLRYIDATKQAAEEDAETAPVVRELYAGVLAGVSLLGLAKRLTQRGVPSPSGRAHWDESTVRSILRNPIYKGVAVARRWQNVRVRGKQRVVPRDGAEHVPLPDWPAPAIVDAQTWALAQEKLDAGRRRVREALPDGRFLLRGGLALCGTCGGVLSLKASHGRRYFYYRCQAANRDPARCASPGGFDAARLDALVWEGDMHLGGDWPGVPRVVAALAAEARRSTKRATVDTREAAREALTRRIARERRAIQQLASSVALAAQPQVADALLAEMESRAAALTAAEDELAALQAAAPTPPARVDLSDILPDQRPEAVRRLDYAERRRLLDHLRVRVRVWRVGATPPYLVAVGVT